MSYSRRKLMLPYNYVIGGADLNRVHNIKDLGVTFDKKLTFKEHIHETTSRAMKQLGFITRVSSNFKDPETYLHLFCTYVRPILEYAAIIWSPRYEIDIQAIETVQNRFLKYIYFKKHREYPPHSSYEHIRVEFGIFKLYHRRTAYSLCFLHKLINNGIICPALLSRVNLYIPDRRVRQKLITFDTKLKGSYIGKICSIYNNVAPHLHSGIFDTQKTIFLREVKGAILKLN